mgnify:CR=1 FL=1
MSSSNTNGLEKQVLSIKQQVEKEKLENVKLKKKCEAQSRFISQLKQEMGDVQGLKSKISAQQKIINGLENFISENKKEYLKCVLGENRKPHNR